MGVNWQNNEYYQAMKANEKTGFSVADQYRINNPFGSHTFLGVLGTQLLPQIFNFSEQALGTGLNGSSQTGSATNVPSRTSTLSDFTSYKQKYDKAKLAGDSKEMRKWALILDKIGQEHNNENGDPTIQNAFKSVSQELKNVINS